MFEVVETFLIQFINILPYIIPLILIMNLVSSMLWGERQMKIYVPENNSFSSCYVVNSANTIRAYSQRPTQNSIISYRDYYYNGHYIYSDGVQTFSQYSTLPTCLQNSDITHDVYYRNDFDSIIIIFFILLIICFYFPYKIISRMLGRWLKL